MWLREVKDQIEADSTRLAYAWLSKAFCRWGEDDIDSRKFFLQGLLHVVVVGATAYTAVGQTDRFL